MRILIAVSLFIAHTTVSQLVAATAGNGWALEDLGTSTNATYNAALQGWVNLLSINVDPMTHQPTPATQNYTFGQNHYTSSYAGGAFTLSWAGQSGAPVPIYTYPNFMSNGYTDFLVAVSTNGTLFGKSRIDPNPENHFLLLPPPPVLEIDFTNGAQLTAPITGRLKFMGTGNCTFSGSATGAIEINAGNVKVASAIPLGTHGVNMTGGSLEATSAMTFPALTMTNAATVKADANNVRVATASGSGALTLTGAVGNEIIYLDEIASTGGVSSATNRVRFTNLTNLHANTAVFNFRLGLDSLPGSNAYGTGAVTAAEVVVNTPNVPAGAFGSLTTSRIILGSNSISQAVTAS